MDPRGLLKFIQPIINRLQLVFGLGTVTETKQEGGLPAIRARFLAEEEHGDIPLMQQPGFASRPLPGARCLVGFLGGERTEGIAFAGCDPRFCPRLEEGEVAISPPGDFLAVGEEAPEWLPEPPEGVDPQGLFRILFKKDRTLEIVATQIKFTINGQQFQFGGEGGSEGIARIGEDKVYVDHGSSKGEYRIIKGDTVCE